MSDPKLTAMMLDLSRNIEKLTGVVKTNTNTNEELQKSNKDTDKNLKDTITKLGGDLKNLNFKELSEGFGDITKNIKELDFKKIGDEFKGATKSFSEIGKSLGDIKSLKDIPKSLEGITKSFSGIKDLTKDLGGITKKLGIDIPGEKFKNISDKVKGAGGKVGDILSGGFGKKMGEDFKGATESFSEIRKSIGDIKSLKDIPKSFESIKGSFGGIKGLTKDLGGVTEKLGIDLPGGKFKNITDKVKGAGGKAKDILSGGFGKKILGAFAEGGTIDKTGSYLVGEKGPEVVKLEEGNNVLSNEKLISADQNLSEKKGKTEKQIAKDKSRAEKKAERLENKAEGGGKFSSLIGGLKESGMEALKGMDISGITGKASEFLSKNIKINNPLLKKASDIGIKSGLDKLSESKLFKDDKPSVDNSDGTKLISDVLPLKKIDPKKIESEEKKSDNAILNGPGTSENIKSNPSESIVNNKGEADKLKPESTTGQTPNKNETNLSKTDIDDMKSILYRIASLLEGPLMVSSTESPFRPNSKRI